MTTAASSLRILHLTAGSDAGGVSRYLLDICGAMRQRGHDITLAGERGAWHDQFERAGFHWIDIPLKGGLIGLWKSARILREFLAEHPVDLLHAHYRRATLLGRRLQKQHHPPLLYTLHLSHMPLGLRRRFSDFGDHTHVASRQGRQWLLDEHLTGDEQITCIPHGVDPEKFPLASEQDRLMARRALGLSADVVVAAYVGRLDYPKNEDWLLDLAERSRASLPDLKILIAGDGPHEADFRAAVAARALSDRVMVLGHRDPLPIYQAADAVLLPSLREGFSYVNAECLSVGTPMLRTHTSGAEDLIEPNVTGLYTPIDREAFIAAAINFLSDVPKLREMGRAGATMIRRSFTLEQQVEKTVELYRELVAGCHDHTPMGHKD